MDAGGVLEDAHPSGVGRGHKHQVIDAAAVLGDVVIVAEGDAGARPGQVDAVIGQLALPLQGSPGAHELMLAIGPGEVLLLEAIDTGDARVHIDPAGGGLGGVRHRRAGLHRFQGDGDRLAAELAVTGHHLAGFALPGSVRRNQADRVAAHQIMAVIGDSEAIAGADQ